SGLLADTLFRQTPVVLTSATVRLGGSFDALAAAVGLTTGSAPRPWRGIDVGSPVDYGRPATVYVPTHVPPPGRDGVSEAVLGELVELVRAAGGRTLGLFSSRRAAEQAALRVRAELDLPVLLQGEDQTAALVRDFAADAASCLFG